MLLTREQLELELFYFLCFILMVRRHEEKIFFEREQGWDQVTARSRIVDIHQHKIFRQPCPSISSNTELDPATMLCGT
jgi:hypothetical protein